MTNVSANNTDSTFLTESEIRTVMIVKDVASALSMIGSLLIIIAYIYLSITVRCKKTNEADKDQDTDEKKINKIKMGYGNDLIFFLSIADFFQGLATFINTEMIVNTEGFDQISTTCTAQAFIFNFFLISSVCWTSIIGLSILLGTSIEDVSRLPKFLCWFALYGFLAPSILTLGPLFNRAFGPSTAWCWLNTRDLNNNAAWAWSLVIFSFIWANIIFNFVSIIKSITYFQIRSIEIEDSKKEESEFLKNYSFMLRIFPMVLIICWIPATVDKIFTLAQGKHNVVSSTFHGLFTGLQGFFNACVYSYYYRVLFKQVFCCQCGKDDEKKDIAILMTSSTDSNLDNSIYTNGTK